MGLACANIRLLTLTSRKADCEYDISIDTMEKMSLTREMSDLSMQYYSKLKSKNISYYANNQYNNINYQYLMGYDSYAANFGRLSSLESERSKQRALKEDNRMILTDYNGSVVMDRRYRDALIKVLGTDCIDNFGRGRTFSKENIPALISAVCGVPAYTEDKIKNVLEGGKSTYSYSYTGQNVLTGEASSSGTATVDTDTEAIQAVIDLYYPIFIAASANGWTFEYYNEMSHNENYISDALVSGSFQLAQVDEYGGYNPDASLTYFCMEGLVIDRQDSNKREEITAWYNAEKERITEKENWLDVEITDLSTELEAINTEMEALKSYIENGVEIFDWGSGS